MADINNGPSASDVAAKNKKRSSYWSWLWTAAVWIYLIISSPWMRWVGLASAAALAVGALAIWIAKKGAKSK